MTFKRGMKVDVCPAYYIYIHAHFDDTIDLDFENVCKVRPACGINTMTKNKTDEGENVER